MLLGHQILTYFANIILLYKKFMNIKYYYLYL